MNTPITRALAALVAMIVLLACPAIAQVQILRQVVGSGATAAVGPNGAIAATVGQAIIGPATSSSHSGWFGFWYTYPQQTSAVEHYTGVVTGASAAVRVAPNPVVDNATITVTLPKSGQITLRLFSAIGEEHMTLIDGHRLAGTTTVVLPARELPSGRYTLVLQTQGGRLSTPLHVVR